MELKTISANKNTVNKTWLLVDAKDEVLGRLASKVAKIIRGKYKTNFTPHVDCGDNVVLINAEKIQLTGNKWEDKKYLKHTGYPGGQYALSPNQLLDKDATRIVINAVKGMLPKNKLGRKILKNLHVFCGSDHNKEAQKPKLIDLKNF